MFLTGESSMNSHYHPFLMQSHSLSIHFQSTSFSLYIPLIYPVHLLCYYIQPNDVVLAIQPIYYTVGSFLPEHRA